MDATGCPEMFVTNYHSVLRKTKTLKCHLSHFFLEICDILLGDRIPVVYTSCAWNCQTAIFMFIPYIFLFIIYCLYQQMHIYVLQH